MDVVYAMHITYKPYVCDTCHVHVHRAAPGVLPNGFGYGLYVLYVADVIYVCVMCVTCIMSSQYVVHGAYVVYDMYVM